MGVKLGVVKKKEMWFIGAMEENQERPVADTAKKGMGMWVVLGIIGLVVVVGGVLMLKNSNTQSTIPPEVTGVVAAA